MKNVVVNYKGVDVIVSDSGDVYSCDRYTQWRNGLKKCASMKGRTSPMKGRKQSEESKAKISEANKNIPRRKGFTLTDETKKKIGEAHKGVPKPKSEEHKRKISETKRGVILSEETKKKMSESRQRWCSKNLEKILQLSLDGEVLRKWDSQSEAFRELGIKQSTFQLHVSNGKPLNGFIYIKENNYKV